MTEERRKDIGLKFVYVVLTAIITLLMSVFFNKTYEAAIAAMSLGNENKREIAVMQECIKSVNNNLSKIDYKLDTILGWKK